MKKRERERSQTMSSFQRIHVCIRICVCNECFHSCAKACNAGSWEWASGVHVNVPWNYWLRHAASDGIHVIQGWGIVETTVFPCCCNVQVFHASPPHIYNSQQLACRQSGRADTVTCVRCMYNNISLVLVGHACICILKFCGQITTWSMHLSVWGLFADRCIQMCRWMGTVQYNLMGMNNFLWCRYTYG